MNKLNKRGLDRVGDLGLDRAFDRASDLTLALNGAPGLAHGLGLASDLARDLLLARNLANDLANDLLSARLQASASVRASILASALDRAGGLAHALDVTSQRAPVLNIGGVRDVVRDIMHDVVRARGRAWANDRERSRVPDQEQRRVVRVVQLADRLLAAAALLLPAHDRARYIEEYRSELWQIAQARRSRRRQLLYAGRQLVSSVRLHAELRAPRQRKAPL